MRDRLAIPPLHVSSPKVVLLRHVRPCVFNINNESYEDEPLPGYHQVPTTNRTLSESWDEYGLEEGNGEDEAVLSSYKDNSSSTKGFPSDLANLESHACPAEDHNIVKISKCYHRGNFSYQGKPPSSNLTAMHANCSPSSSAEQFWVADTGATAHMTSDLSQLSLATPFLGNETITTAGGSAPGLISILGYFWLLFASTTLFLVGIITFGYISQLSTESQESLES
ncbi:hypothetical protein L3X38_016697 [Prunus dulcis]|uniref:Uncharacterized protein n=1 Tax=Prunus dulcis TaxID=3755 RepID=A0AAD4W8B1_PRUDU|nr:hypothetical protein L3X38_016697 [Prunus dulcis]